MSELTACLPLNVLPHSGALCLKKGFSTVFVINKGTYLRDPRDPPLVLRELLLALRVLLPILLVLPALREILPEL